MARTLSVDAAAAVESKNGTLIRYIVSIEWTENAATFYSAEEYVVDGVLRTRPRLISVSPQVMEWAPDQITGVESLSITIEDADGSLKSLIEGLAAPGAFRKPLSLYLWPGAETTWPDDRVILFGGFIVGAKFDTSERTWELKAESWESLYDKPVGVRASRDVFPELPCDREGRHIVPLVYGNPCTRVPAVLIDRPGWGRLSQTLAFYESELRIVGDAEQQAFDIDADPATLVLGWPGHTETVTGTWGAYDAGNDYTPFTIETRSHWLGSGDGADGAQITASNAHRYSGLWLPGDSQTGGGELIPNWETVRRIGHVVAVEDVHGVWHNTLVLMWDKTAAGVTVTFKGHLDVDHNSDWRLSALPGFVPIWPGGVPVMESAPWRYAVNSAESEEIVRVEGRSQDAQTRQQRGVSPVWWTFDESHWSETLDDDRYGTDAPITTIDMAAPPQFYGLDPEVYVTLKASIPLAGGTAVETPHDVLRHLLQHDAGGAIPDSMINATAFTDAQTELEADGRDVKLAFAIGEPLRAIDLAKAVATQATCRLGVVDGQVNLQALQHIGDRSPATTSDKDTTPLRGITETEPDAVNLEAKWTGRVRRFPTDKHPALLLTHDEEFDTFGPDDRQVEWPAYQSLIEATKAQEFAHKLVLEQQRRVDHSRFLDATKVVPVDHAAVDVVGVTYSEARVERAEADRHELSLSAVGKLWNSAPVQTESESECEPVQEYDAVALTSTTPHFTYPADTQGEIPNFPLAGCFCPVWIGNELTKAVPDKHVFLTVAEWSYINDPIGPAQPQEVAHYNHEYVADECRGSLPLSIPGVDGLALTRFRSNGNGSSRNITLGVDVDVDTILDLFSDIFVVATGEQYPYGIWLNQSGAGYLYVTNETVMCGAGITPTFTFHSFRFFLGDWTAATRPDQVTLNFPT